MSKKSLSVLKPKPSHLFERVSHILEESREKVVRSVNNQMVLSYWSIGREIVEAVQAGEERAGYGKRLLEDLSEQLNERYGKGFSVVNLKNFRKFYLAFNEEDVIGYPTGAEFKVVGEESSQAIQCVDSSLELLELSKRKCPEFNPQLTWSHYRALMRVENREARDFYEKETVECGWSKAQLERQIQTSYYDRILANKEERGISLEKRDRLEGDVQSATQILKSSYVLEFLNLPDTASLHESDLEQAIIDNLQSFLLELGNGFSFVARQRQVRFEDQEFYVDLVFYNYILKCFVLIDLKMGQISHQDVGQMDGYVRLYEDQFKIEGDNPTLGLILCSAQSEAVAKYSVLSDAKQIFASKYQNLLPSEEELRKQLVMNRRQIEDKKNEE